MDIDVIKRNIGKHCKIILKNNYEYTAVIPDFNGTSFEIKDKFNKTTIIECSFIAFIQVQDENQEDYKQ